MSRCFPILLLIFSACEDEPKPYDENLPDSGFESETDTDTEGSESSTSE